MKNITLPCGVELKVNDTESVVIVNVSEPRPLDSATNAFISNSWVALSSKDQNRLTLSIRKENLPALKELIDSYLPKLTAWGYVKLAWEAVWS